MVYEGLPGVITIFEVWVACAVGVSLIDLVLELVGAVDVVLALGFELVEVTLVVILALDLGGVGVDELVEPGQYCVAG